jgi:ABC-2 type transport system ATP-binding protein
VAWSRVPASGPWWRRGVPRRRRRALLASQVDRLIRALMNIIRPSAGEARVLGVDTRRLGPRELETIGYVPENQDMPGWMTLAELLAYCRPFYPAWDDALSAKLVSDFALPLGVKLGRMSRGMRLKAALISALAYRPRLLVLDEPFSGLDPVVRDDSFTAF